MWCVCVSQALSVESNVTRSMLSQFTAHMPRAAPIGPAAAVVTAAQRILKLRQISQSRKQSLAMINASGSPEPGDSGDEEPRAVTPKDTAGPSPAALSASGSSVSMSQSPILTPPPAPIAAPPPVPLAAAAPLEDDPPPLVPSNIRRRSRLSISRAPMLTYSSQRIALASSEKLAAPSWPARMDAAREEAVRDMCTMHFNVLDVSDEELVRCAVDMVTYTGLLAQVEGDHGRLVTFVDAISKQYRAGNPYHNFKHGMGVLHVAFVTVLRSGLMAGE